MKYALIKDGIVQNIIEYDEESLLPDIERYEAEHAEYLLKKAEYDSKVELLVDEYNSYIADLAALKIEAKALSVEVDKVKEKEIKRKLMAIKYPSAPAAPKPAKGKYAPDENYVMVEIEDGCFVGQSYQDGQFIFEESE